MTGPGEPVVVLVDHGVVPTQAVPLLRGADTAHATAGVADLLGLPTPSARPTLLFTDDLTEPVAAELVAAGARVVAAPGRGLRAAVAVMDRLRSPGGCPWDAEQTHDSLREYLLEECYELLDALADGDRVAIREELGDVLLQVLFHARITQEHTEDPFDVDTVAEDLVAKLVGRHPHVFAGGDPAVRDAASQERRWDELKRLEKRRESSLDGVPGSQPSLSLAAKFARRTDKAKLPTDLLPRGGGIGEWLFQIAAHAKLAGTDPELALRAVAKRFAADVRAAECAARESGVDPAAMDNETWRRFWPR